MKKKNGGVLSVVFFGIAAVVIAMALASLAAYGITTEFITQELASVLVPLILGISVFAGAIAAAFCMQPQGRLPAALGVAGVYLVVSITAKLAFFPGSTEYLLRNFIVCSVAALAAGILCSRRGKRKNTYSTKRRR